MRHLLTTVLSIIFTLVMTSCSKEGDLYKNKLIVYDADDSGFTLSQVGLPTYSLDKNHITFRIKGEGKAVDDELATIETEYGRVHSGNLGGVVSKDKISFYEAKIFPRVKSINEAFSDASFPRNDVLTYGDGCYYYAYMRSVPSVVADKELFGRPAGTELNDLMYLYGQPAIRKEGEGFKMDYDVINDMLMMPLRDCLTSGTLLPYCMDLVSTSFPEELKNHESVHLTVSISVTFEHFWEYMLAKEKDENASLRVVDKDMTITVELQMP